MTIILLFVSLRGGANSCGGAGGDTEGCQAPPGRPLSENQARLTAEVAEAEQMLYVPGEGLNTLDDLLAKADAGPKPESVMSLEAMDLFE